MEYVEIRVHGVHGTSPGSMLGVAEGDVQQVAGDQLTGFYRSRSGELPYRRLARQVNPWGNEVEPPQGRISVEAYSWGSLTSGVRGLFGWLQRALWLLLLPFALANLAYWARLHLDGRDAAARWGARCTRLGALLLTVFMVLAPAIVGVDLVAWQCYRGGSPGCEPLPGVLDFLADLTAGQRLAAGSALPLLFLLVLWLLSRQSLLRYEEVSESLAPPPTGQHLTLRHRHLWQGKARTQQLQRIHLAVGLALVVWFTGVHAGEVAVSQSDAAAVRPPLAVAAGVVLLAVIWLLSIHPHDVERVGVRESRWGTIWHAVGRRTGAGALLRDATWRRIDRWLREDLPGALLLAALAVTGWHLAVLWRLGDLRQGADFVGHNFWYVAVFVLLAALHVAVFTGDRMGRWGTLAVLVVVVLLGVGAVLAHLGWPQDDVTGEGWLPDLTRAAASASWVPDGDRWGYLLVPLLAGLYAVLAIWHGCEGTRHRRAAWNGAGASVLLAAAAWVALLFTTAGVTATANYLNGGDHGVGDLVSQLGDTDSRALAGVPSTSRGRFTLVGDVVVRDAVITVQGAEPRRVVLESGTVEADQVFRGVPGGAAAGDLDRQQGRLRLDEGRVFLPEATVQVVDSCLDPDEETCSAELSSFVAGGQLTVDGETIELDASGPAVTVRPREPPTVPLVIPQVLIWAPLTQTLWLFLGVLWVVGALLWFRRTHADLDRQIAADGIPPRDRHDARKARRAAAFAHRAERLVDGLGAITAVLIVGLIALSATGRPPWEVEVFAWIPRWASTAALYVASALGLALVLLLSRVRTSAGTRRAVGVLWDLTTFWPRAAHPLAPPCYAERVVPELAERIEWALHARGSGADGHPGGRPGGRSGGRSGNVVVLSAHSQGSVIACAVLSRLPRQDLARVRVITYGSQIRALYGRVFPAVFGPQQIGYVPTPGPTRLGAAFPDAPPAAAGPVDRGRRLPPATVGEDPTDSRPLVHRVLGAGGQWVNLFRRSDPLGYRVFSDHDSTCDVYVPEVPDVVVGDPGPRVMTHSGYQHTLAYRTAVAGWTGEQVVPEAGTTSDLPALP